VRAVLWGIIFRMGGDVTVVDAITSLLWLTGEVFFKWVPGTVVSVVGSGNTSEGSMLFQGVIPEPVTTAELVRFLNENTVGGGAELFLNWSVFVAISIFVSLLAATVIIYCALRVRQIRHLERLQLEAVVKPVASHDVSRAQLRWNRIMEQTISDSEQYWRLAILEADIMLNELLDSLGYKGETMADKMKQVNRAGFNTIDLAWEAHKVRNEVAHEGSNLLLNAREVRRVIGLYERVFKEFKYIE
jgi:hypothetical protein